MNTTKLLTFGFVLQDNAYCYTEEILDGTFRVDVTISLDGMLSYKVVDTATEEEYVLVNVPAATGAFVGNVRVACENVVSRVKQSCFESEIFRSNAAKEIVRYIGETYGAPAEFLWERTPHNAIFRDSKTNKWYAVLLTVEKRKLGFADGGDMEIINLKETPEKVPQLLTCVGYLPAYHMNKKHWYTICLDGSVPIEKIFEHIDQSAAMVCKGEKRCVVKTVK